MSAKCFFVTRWTAEKESGELELFLYMIVVLIYKPSLVNSLRYAPFGLQRKTQRYAYEFYSPRPNRSLRSLGRIPVWLFFVVCNEINIIKLVIIISLTGNV